MGEDIDVFRKSFKYYKRKNPIPDFSDVIDFRHSSSVSAEVKISGISCVKLVEPRIPQPVCFSPVGSWKAYSLQCHPGFFFIVNPFVNGYDRYWVKRCLEDYSKPPNRSNLDTLVGKSAWQNAWISSLSEDSKQKALLDRLHWVTLGLHHNWDTKEYSMEDQGKVPLDLGLLTQYIANTLGFTSYLPEAAILNYYHIGSTLGGHTDHSEFNHDAPVISLSFGCSAVFLLGGHSKGIRPVAMFVDSGDILVLSGHSRLSYHAVPRIMGDAERYSNCSVVARDSDIRPTVVYECQVRNTECSPVGATALDKTQMCCHCEVTSSMALELKCSSFDHGQICPLPHYDDDSLTALMSKLNTNMNQVLETLRWTPFQQFLSKRRINLNVRQVFIDTVCNRTVDSVN